MSKGERKFLSQLLKRNNNNRASLYLCFNADYRISVIQLEFKKRINKGNKHKKEEGENRR